MNLHPVHNTQLESPCGEFCIVGTAFYQISSETDFSADVGGIDGVEVTASLVQFSMHTITLTADQIVGCVGAKAVMDEELAVAESCKDNTVETVWREVA